MFDVKYRSGREMRLVNVYDQLRQGKGVKSQGRPAQTARWREIMEREKILLGGDWNTHSDRWDPECPPRRDANVLENLMDEYNLLDVTDGEGTHSSERQGEISKSLIDFFLTKTSMVDSLEISIDLTTTSDHALVFAHLRWDEGEEVKVWRTVMGWNIDGLKSKEDNFKKAQQYWKDKSSERPVLDETSSGEDFQKEAEWIQQNFVNHLNRCC